MDLYPLTFVPRFVPKMWGGRKIHDILGKELPRGEPIGESWELFDFPPGVVEGAQGWVSAAVSNGPLAGRTLHSLVEEFGPSLLGDVPLSEPGKQFPILIKFLDAAQDLSVQVHPDKRYAAANPGAFLKSEAWYVIQSDPGAKIYKGLTTGVTPEAFAKAVAAGSVESMIRTIPAKPGDCFYLPSGTIHALGAGLLVAEVQTPSDTTFRVYDFNRVDPSTGKQRKLHVDQALKCIDFSAEPPPSAPSGNLLAQTEYFKLEKVRLAKGASRPIGFDQPAVWIILEGALELRAASLKQPVRVARGQTVLLPPRMREPNCRASADSVLLEVTFPPSPR